MDEQASDILRRVNAMRATGLSRRAFVRAAGLASGSVVAASLIAACGGTTVPGATSESGQAPTSSSASSGTTSPAASQSTITSGTPKRGGTMTAAMQVDVTSLDPHRNNSYSSTLVIEQVYSGLIQLDPNLNVKPDLAESWNISADGLTYTFKIRQGVKFHSGREMTVDDVVYSLNRVKNPASSSSYLLNSVKTITAPDPQTVVLTLSTPFSALISHLTTAMAVVPKEVVQKNGDLSKVMDGTGPFKFVEFIPNAHTKLVRNPDYYQAGVPYLDGLTWIPVSDDPTRTADIETGNVDFADQIAQSDITKLSQTSGVVLAHGIGTLHDYLMMNCARKPFSDVRVRQAVAMAIDRAAMTQTILFGFGTPIDGGPIPKWSWAYANLHIYEKPNISKAKQLLADAGYPNGFKLNIGAGSNYAAQVQEAEILKSFLAKIGIDVTPKPTEWGTYIDQVITKRNFDAAIIGWIGAIDPDDWLYNRFHTNAPDNNLGYSNVQVDKLLDEGRALSDQAKRKPLYDQAQQIIVTEAPDAFFYLYDQYEALRDHVKGYQHMANASKATFKTVWLDKA